MLEKDVIHAKVAIIKRCLERIKSVTKLNPDSLSDFNVQDVFILNLQRAIQATIDIANVIISSNNYRLPNSFKMAFKILHENNWINPSTCKQMQRMVGFRNIAVHDYQEIDLEILKSILAKNLSDFERFYKQILNKISAKN